MAVDPAEEDGSADRFRALWDSSPVALVFGALDGTVTSINPAGCALAGRPEHDIVGRPAIELMDPDHQVAAEENMARLRAGGPTTLRAERRYPRPDGTAAWGDSFTQVVMDADGAPSYWRAVIVDITARRKAEEAQARLATIVQSSPDAIVSSTVEGIITTWNSGAEQLYGYTAEEVLGRDGRLLWPAEEREAMEEGVTRVGGGQTVTALETTRIRKDGSSVSVSITASPISDASGTVVGVATVSRDLSERDRASARFRSLLDAGPDAVIGTDASHRVILANAAAERLFDRGPGLLIGSELGTVLVDAATPGSDAWAMASPSADRAEDDANERQITGHRRDGTTFPAEVTLSVFDDDGPTLLIGVRDGTDRQQAALVTSSPDAIVSTTLDGTVTSWNQGAERMYGYAASAMVGSDATRLIPKDRLDEIEDIAGHLVAGGSVDLVETQRLHRDGRLLDVSMSFSPVVGPSGVVIGASAVARDVTEQKRAQDALRASDALKTAILEASLDSVITMDEAGLIVEFNPAAEAVFGYARSEVVGQPMAEILIPARLRSAHASGVARYLSTGVGPILGRRIAQTALRRDGSEFAVELAVKRVDVAGPAHFTAYVRDLTHEHRQAAERDELELRLAQAHRLESLGQLAGGIAHDFNNLLGVIVNYAAFVSESVSGDEQASDDVAEIVAAADRAAELTRQLLIFGRREPVLRQTLDLNSIVEGIRTMLSRTLGEHIDLQVVTDPRAPTIHADPGQLEQVLVNLVVNARDAMPDGGRLSLETDVVELDEPYCLLHPGTEPGRFVELSVGDTGRGMPPEVVERIFEPFFTTKAPGEGTGLGLATAYGIVSESGGVMSVYSEPDVGTVFRILFPVAVHESGADAPRTKQVPAPGRGEVVLLVEDEPAMMRSTARMLEANGYTVIAAPSGSEALEVVRTRGIDLLLTDVVMPEVSGQQLAERVRAVHPGSSVLFMSGFSQGILGLPSLDASDGVLLRKPFTEADLLERVRSAIDGPDR